jgi:hypothetical protein
MTLSELNLITKIKKQKNKSADNEEPVNNEYLHQLLKKKKAEKSEKK